jgi:hypothetical protein
MEDYPHYVTRDYYNIRDKKEIVINFKNMLSFGAELNNLGD